MNNQLKEILNRFNTAIDFIEDLNLLNKCKEILKNYDRFEAIAYIQKSIKRYRFEIAQFGILDGVCVIDDVDYSALNDFQIIDQLIYIGQRIPIYAFIREGEKAAADYLLNRVANFGFGAYEQQKGD